jgi:DNA-binding response OmpR family regulator
LVEWPREDARRSGLARRGVPRLLLVAEDAPPPLPLGDHEDWIRLPAAEQDVFARVRQLDDQSEQNRCTDDVPAFVADQVLQRGGAMVVLTPLETALTTELLAAFGRVVPREQLQAAAWPDGAPNRRSTDTHLYRLRRRLLDLGLAIAVVRGRGFMLYDADADADAPVVSAGRPA